MGEHNAEIIEDFYNELHALGAVKSSEQFSIEWLGMQNSYLRCLRARNKKPSVKAWANLAVRLKATSQTLASNEKPKIARTGKRFAKMADRCIDEILAGSRQDINAH